MLYIGRISIKPRRIFVPLNWYGCLNTGFKFFKTRFTKTSEQTRKYILSQCTYSKVLFSDGAPKYTVGICTDMPQKDFGYDTALRTSTDVDCKV